MKIEILRKDQNTQIMTNFNEFQQLIRNILDGEEKDISQINVPPDLWLSMAENNITQAINKVRPDIAVYSNGPAK